MKILAISNISGAVERVADMFENTNASVMAKEEANDIAGIRDKISAAFSKGIYDYAVVVVEDYISATAILNKSDEITAAVFDSEDDMAFLNGSKVNTLIIKASRKTLTFLGILANVHASSGRKSEASSTAKAEKLAEKNTNTHEWFPIHMAHVPSKEISKPKQSAGGDEPPMAGRKGIMGKLKDSLGIIDE